MKVPVTKEEHQSMTYLPEFNKAHGTNLDSWEDYYNVIKFDYSEFEDGQYEEEYEAYVKWCEILNSPLYKALL